MAKIKVKFNNKDYQIEESAFAPAGEKVVTHITGEMKGTGATVKFGGTAYDVDSTKLSSSAAALAAHLGTIVGSGVKIVIGGVEYGVDSAKVESAVTEVETTLAGMSGSEEPDVPVEPEEPETPDVPEVDGSEWLDYYSNGDGTCYVGGIGVCDDTDVIIPSVSPDGDSVTSIGQDAFFYCDHLTSIVIPNSVTSIGESAFLECSSLTSVTISDSVTSIGDFAFGGCSSLTSINFNGTMAQWRAIKNDHINDRGTGNYTVHCTDGDITKDGEIITPEEEFPASEGLEFTSNGDSTCYVSGIGTCTDTDVVIPSVSPEGDSVTSIGEEALQSCTSFTSVTIPDSVTSIGRNAFDNCYSLTSVTIPNSVTSIGRGAFEDCFLLKTITFVGTMAQWNAISKEYDWNYGIECTIHCTDGDIIITHDSIGGEGPI